MVEVETAVVYSLVRFLILFLVVWCLCVRRWRERESPLISVFTIQSCPSASWKGSSKQLVSHLCFRPLRLMTPGGAQIGAWSRVSVHLGKMYLWRREAGLDLCVFFLSQ